MVGWSLVVARCEGERSLVLLRENEGRGQSLVAVRCGERPLQAMDDLGCGWHAKTRNHCITHVDVTILGDRDIIVGYRYLFSGMSSLG